MFIFPLYAVMFQDSGLDAFQISTLFIVWSAVSFTLVVPSGVLADKYSRKKILIIAQIFKIVGFGIWLAFPTYTGFLLGFIFWGAQGAFRSGTFEALLYDELALFKKTDQYTKIYGRTRTAEFVGFIAASAIASGIFAVGGYPLVLSLSLVAIVASITTLFTFPKAKKRDSTHEAEYFTLLKQGIKTSIHTPILLRLIIFISLMFAIDSPIDEYYTIFSRDVGLQTKYLGIFLALAGIIEIGGALSAHRFNKYSNTTYYIFFTLCGVVLLGASLIFNIASLTILVIFSFLYRILKTIFESKLQDEIPTKVRATTSSVKDFIVEIGNIVLIASFGYIANKFSIRFGFISISILMIALGIAYLTQRSIRVKKRGKV